jgi:hypothetical protein
MRARARTPTWLPGTMGLPSRGSALTGPTVLSCRLLYHCLLYHCLYRLHGLLLCPHLVPSLSGPPLPSSRTASAAVMSYCLLLSSSAILSYCLLYCPLLLPPLPSSPTACSAVLSSCIQYCLLHCPLLPTASTVVLAYLLPLVSSPTVSSTVICCPPLSCSRIHCPHLLPPLVLSDCPRTGF